MKVAIVILNWNGRKLLEQFLPSVVEYTSNNIATIIVADNNSTDDSILFLKENYPAIRIIKLTQNHGFAKGYNEALKEIEAEYYVLLNSDIEVSFGWLKPLIDYLESHDNVAAAQPKILSYKQKTHFEYAGASGGYIDKLGFPFCRGRIFDTLEPDYGQYNSIEDVFWASGACMAIKSNCFWEAGGFDSNFFAHMEEIDLCWRLKARGKRIVCIPQSTVFHIGGATLDENSPQKVYLNFRNNMLMLYKNLETQSLRKIIKKRFLYNHIAALKYLGSGQLKQAKAIYKAHKGFKKMKKQYIAIREENIRKTTSNTIAEIYQGNIVIDYYLRGKKKFSELFSLENIN